MRLAILLVLVAIAGCATEAKFTAKMNNWPGQKETELVATYGAPSSVYANGNTRILTYQRSGTAIIPGVAPTYTATANGYGGATLTPSGGSPSVAVAFGCRVEFTIIDGMITSWRATGNRCVAD